MTNVVLAPARFPPHIQMVLSPPLVYLVSYLVSSHVCLSSVVHVSLSLVCVFSLSPSLYGVVSVWSPAVVSGLLSRLLCVCCRFSPHMKNNHMKSNMLVHAYSIGSHNMLTTAYGSPTCACMCILYIYAMTGADAGSNHICRRHSRSAQRFHSQNDPR